MLRGRSISFLILFIVLHRVDVLKVILQWLHIVRR